MSADSTHHSPTRKRPDSSAVVAAVRSIQRGQAVEAHYEFLFKRFEPAVRQRLRYRGWHGADLEDLVQEVMVRVCRGVKTFRFDASFTTWVLRIVTNTEKNARRDRHTAKARAVGPSLDQLSSADDDRGPALPEPEAPGDDPLDATLAKERKQRLMAALDALPTRVRQCLLFRYQGYRYREIAEAQGVSVATVKKQVVDGHRRLRPLLGSFVELFGLVLALLLLACH